MNKVIIIRYCEIYLKKKNRNILKAVLYLEDNYLTNVTVEDLVKWNNIENADVIHTGQELIVK